MIELIVIEGLILLVVGLIGLRTYCSGKKCQKAFESKAYSFGFKKYILETDEFLANCKVKPFTE